MGGGGGGGTQRVEPPKYQLPFLQSGVQRADALYRQQVNGSNIAPLSTESQQALGGITARATQGSDVNRGASSLAATTLNGGFLGANPYLDATFNKAALATQGQLASQFAGSGRDVEGSRGLRAQELNDLATSIYGGAYDAERNRQQQVLGMAPGIANQDYFDMNQLASVGASREGYQQELLDAPGNALDEYIGRVSGNMGQTIKTDQARNRGAGALGGAMMGSQMGGQFGGMGSMWGGLIGAGLGGWG